MTTRRGKEKTFPLKTETFDEVIEVATKLFGQLGFTGTGIAEIVREVGITNAGLYYYVSSKQELLYHVLDRGLADTLDTLESIAHSDGPADSKLEAAIGNHLDLVFRKSGVIHVFLRERRFLGPMYTEKYRARLKRYDEIFDRLIADVYDVSGEPQQNPKYLRLCILGMLNWTTEWYESDGKLTELEARQYLTKLALERVLQARV